MQYSAWQLSAEHRTPQLCPVTSGHTCGGLAWHNLTLPCPLGIWSRLVPMPPLLLNQRENKIIIKNQTPLKYPHPLHAILGQMNKQKLLFLTFMQNDRGGWGKIEHGSDIVTGGGAPTRNTRTCPDHGSATADHNVSSLEPCPICSWSLAGILSSLGVGSNAVPGVRVLGSQTHTAQQRRQSSLPKSVWNQTGELRKWSLATTCPHTGSPTRAA